jgi:RimJ/RimL family protein N-acetyltransferase
MMLTTERLSLRPFRPGDLAAVHAYAADPAVVEFMEYGPNTEQESADFLAEAMIDDPDRWLWAIVRRADEAVLGATQLLVSSEQHQRGELGYVLARSAWGAGYATEAATAVLDFGLTGAALHRVMATTDPANAGSVHVLEKIGMRREGIMREHFLVRGEWRDRALYAKVASPRVEVAGQA